MADYALRALKSSGRRTLVRWAPGADWRASPANPPTPFAYPTINFTDLSFTLSGPA
jgi:hypothetical protein